MADEPTVSPQRCPRTLNGRILLVAAGFAGIYFLIGYGESAVPYLPWLFLLACPLMHVFMHRGHGGHGGHGKPGKKAPRPKEGRAPSPGPSDRLSTARLPRR